MRSTVERDARRRLSRAVGVAVAVAALALLSTAANAFGASIELTRGSTEPVESIATQLGANVSGANGDEFWLFLKSTGGEGCAENPAADGGREIILEDISETGTAVISRNWSFENAGEYRLCAWLTHEGSSNTVEHAETTLRVRVPHLAISIAAPPVVSVNQTFQVLTTAQAETERSVYEYTLPNTGDGCPANASAAGSSSGSRSLIEDWNVTGGPFTESKNDSFEGAGVYLVCAYFVYESTGKPPELTASGQFTVTAPCVVPDFAFGAPLATVEAELRAASCAGGSLHYTISTSVHRGDVVGLNPRPGTSLPTGTRVALDVSAGPPCVVPSVRPGANVHHVEHLLAAAHCGYALAHGHSGRARRGTVVGLGSRGHSHLFPGTKVRIIVSTGG
jgi:hypothetical protein